MKLSRFYEFVQADFEAIKSFYLKDELNPKLWEGFDLDEEIRRDLLRIGKDFYDGTGIEADVLDIVLCGSLCNYNWSERYSDYDLHIIIDLSDVDENPEMAESHCDFAKKLWNSQHDIKIAGYEVEVAIQDKEDMKRSIKAGRMGGAFSLMKDEWIKKPEKTDFEPDEMVIRKKAIPIMEQIDELEEEISEDRYEAFKEKIDKVWKKVKDFRKSGLESESGEFSTGNLTFKLLRRNGYITKVMEMKSKSYDRQFR